MTVSFPALCPSRRSFTPGKYPTKRFASISGAGSTRLYGSKAFDATLELEFAITDADLANILKSWHDSKGGAYVLTLPAMIFEGIERTTQEQIPDYLNWRWAEMPSVESLFPGRSRVRVQLIATLDT
jgi:hypothetical protein